MTVIEKQTSRAFASIRKSGGVVELVWRGRSLSLDALEPHTIAWLAARSPPVLVEVEVIGLGAEDRVVRVGAAQPHPRMAALADVERGRYQDALAALERLAEVDDVLDAELLFARFKANVGLKRLDVAEADFVALVDTRGAEPSTIVAAFLRLPEELAPRCSQQLMNRIESLANTAPGSLPWRTLLSHVRLEFLSLSVLLGALHETLSERDSLDFDMDQLQGWLSRAEKLAPTDARVAQARARLGAVRDRLALDEKRRAAALLRARPNFDEVETSFGVKLPLHLRRAWERHYEGHVLGFGFIEVRQKKIAALTRLANMIKKRLGADGVALLPFALGEHRDDYFALDLTRPTSSGDYPVLQITACGWGDCETVSATSLAWLEKDGVPQG